MSDSIHAPQLEKVYSAKTPEELRASYDAWADKYDEDVQAFGRILPTVVLGLASRHLPHDNGPILDAGAGTGCMGELLALLGYDRIHALDISAGMLKVAESKKVYTRLIQAALGETLDIPDDTYGGMVATGVFTVSHAGPECLDELLRVMKPGAVMAFTVTHPVYVSGFQQKMKALEKAGTWTLIEVTPEFPTHQNSTNAPMCHGFAYRVN